jgi:hypothetical protein
MENLSANLAAEESHLPFHIIQQVRDIISLNEPQETTKNLIKKIAIENNNEPESLLKHFLAFFSILNESPGFFLFDCKRSEGSEFEAIYTLITSVSVRFCKKLI